MHALCKFFKDYKTAQAHRASANCSLWKMYRCFTYTKLQEKSCCFFKIIYMKKMQDKQNFESVHTISTLYSCHNFAFILHE